MKPLIVLLAVFVISVGGLRVSQGNYDPAFAARIAMAAMLAFTAMGHFAFTKGMAMMLPAAVPFRVVIVYLTGFIEIAAAIGLMLGAYYHVTGEALILFFILMLPANIYAALNHVDYQKGTTNGNGPGYLWFRVPLQVMFIVWVYVSAVMQ